MSYNTNNLSDTLYVSVNGNNASAVKGDPARPWRTPQDARTASSDGDLIHVFAGTYSYGNLGSGADYEGLGTGHPWALNQEASLNYGVSNINYYFEPGTLLQGIDGGAGLPPPLFFEPQGQNPEGDPSTIKVRGGMSVDTPGQFILMLRQDSDWDIHFEDVITCSKGVTLNISIVDSGGTRDTAWAKSLKVKGKSITSTGRGVSLGELDDTAVSTGRIGISRGLVDIDIDYITSAWAYSVEHLYNYDIFLKHKIIDVQQWTQIHGIKESICHFECDELYATGTSSAPIEALSAMPGGEIYVKVGKMSYTGLNIGSAVMIDNFRGAGGKVFLHVDHAESDSTQDAAIRVRKLGAAESKTVFQNGGFLGETEVVISGNFYEDNDAKPVLDLVNNSYAIGANGNILIRLKDCSLIHRGSGTNSIDSANAGEEILIQNVTANLPVAANATEVGGTVTVNAGFTH